MKRADRLRANREVKYRPILESEPDVWDILAAIHLLGARWSNRVYRCEVTSEIKALLKEGGVSLEDFIGLKIKLACGIEIIK